MESKGVAVKSTQKFVEDKYPERYKEWIESLSNKSKCIMTGKIFDGAWYDLHDSIVEPMKKICDMFYWSSDRGAWEVGRYNAEVSLKGIYSFFIKTPSPELLISKASHIMSTFYRPCEMKSKQVKNDEAYLYIVSFKEPNHLVELRIGGWAERTLEFCGCKNLKLTITKSLAKGDKLTEYQFSWS